MTTATQPRNASVAAADPRLAALLHRQALLDAAIERRAVEVVRAWLIERGRCWLAVDFTKTRPEPPLDGEDGLAAAVSSLPRQAFGSGLDVRGSFIVRLADLNAILSRSHDDQTPVPPGPRLEVVIVRDPDGGTDATTFVDGVQVDDYDEYIVDAGRGHTYSDWIESRDCAMAAASPAAAALLAQCYDNPPGSQYIDDAPQGWPFDDGEAS